MNDICLIVAPQNKGWILDRIAHEVGRKWKDPIYCYDPDNVPKADRYFVTHYSLLPKVMQQINPGITPVTCFFTHESASVLNYIDAFNLCHSVIAENEFYMTLLEKSGVSRKILHFVPECSDPTFFKPHNRTGKGYIVICGKNYTFPRKNPKLIAEIVSLLPNRKFVFNGPEWERDIPPLNNVEFNNVSYENYPEIYEGADVYLSCSTIEGGGPNSLIEAMHSNVFPVVSDVGNARDYITHGYNGYIFPVDSPASHVVGLIEKAYLKKPKLYMPYNDIWQTVQDFSWDKYGNQIKSILTDNYYDQSVFPVKPGESIFKA